MEGSLTQTVAHPRDGRAVIPGLEDSAASDEDVGASGVDVGDVVRSDATIDLDQNAILEIFGAQQLAQFLRRLAQFPPERAVDEEIDLGLPLGVELFGLGLDRRQPLHLGPSIAT